MAPPKNLKTFPNKMAFSFVSKVQQIGIMEVMRGAGEVTMFQIKVKTSFSGKFGKMEANIILG